MTIGSNVNYSTDFTQADGSLPADFNVIGGANGNSTYGVVSNDAHHTGGDAVLSWALLNPSLIGDANNRVKTQVLIYGGAWMRASVSGNNITGYFLRREGSGVLIDRVVAGTATSLVAFTYVGALDGAANAFLQCDCDTDGSGNVVLTISTATSENGTYTQRATYTDSSGSKITTAGAVGIGTNTVYSAGLRTWAYVRAIGTAPSTAPTLTSGTPSGTLGTQTTATLGATTNQTTGTLYGVVDSAANLSGVTELQIKAGQKASGAAALSSGNASVSTTTPSIAITGLTAGTLYSYAIVQNNTNGDSNIVTGTFTAAAATHAASLTIVDAAGANVASTSLNWRMIQSNAVVGYGTTSTDGSGLLSLTVAGASTGSALLVYQNAGNTLSGERTVTVS